jgi:NCS2 family nucleobase:cation symporter-2
MATSSARKPSSIAYGVDEVPPRMVVALSVFQQLGVMSIFLIVPVLIGREAGGAPRLVADLVGISFVVLGVGALLQALPRVGSGFLCQPVPTAIYLVPSLLAARRGGLPLVFGMTVCAGLVEVALSRAIRKLRPLSRPRSRGSSSRCLVWPLARSGCGRCSASALRPRQGCPTRLLPWPRSAR